MDAQELRIFEEWNRRVTRAAWIHSQSATFYAFWHTALGIPLVVLTAVVGAISSTKGDTGSSIIAPLSVAAAVLAALQTFLNLSERSQNHKRSSAEYGKLRRTIEEACATPPTQDVKIVKRIHEIKNAFDALAESTPVVPGFIWRRGEKKYDRAVYRSTVITIVPPGNEERPDQ